MQRQCHKGAEAQNLESCGEAVGQPQLFPHDRDQHVDADGDHCDPAMESGMLLNRLESRKMEAHRGVDDLNCISPFCAAGCLPHSGNAHREERFFSAHGVGPSRVVSSLRCPLSRRLQGSEFPLLGAILGHVLRAGHRESPVDLEGCLRSRRDQLYHMGFRSVVAHSALADAYRIRDWRIYTDFAQRLIARARRRYAQDPLDVELEHTI